MKAAVRGGNGRAFLDDYDFYRAELSRVELMNEGEEKNLIIVYCSY